MYTTCPECGTVFRVTVAVLRTARGQVRCGVCAATFDALLYLSENVEAEEPSTTRAAHGAANAGHAGHAVDTADTATHEALPEDARGYDDAHGIDEEPEAAADLAARPDAEPAAAAALADAEPALAADEIDAVLAGGDFDLDLEFEDSPSPDPVVAPHDTSARDAAATPMDASADDLPLEVAAELLVANADSLPPPEFPPFDAPAHAASAVVTPFERRAGRLTPSADEDRALAEIAAALARDTRDADGNAVLEEIPDSALEFDLPAEKWDEVFVADPGTPTIPPLDPVLAAARDAALAAAPPPGADADDLEVEIEAIELGTDDATTRADDARAPFVEDPLAQTDTFPPLHVTPEEEAASGLADTPAARPHGGVAAAVHAATHPATTPTPGASSAPLPTPDFDALVAAAAARAAARIGGRASAAPGLAAAPAPVPPATATPAYAHAAPRPSRAALDRTPEPEPAPAGADAEAPDWIEFDAKRFHAVARGGSERAWWATTLLALGIVVLALGLGAQLVHYWRDTLAQHPVAGPPLRELYARLGLPLEPEWNLAGYELKQWGAATDAEPGTLRVRASVVNRAPRAQPHPLLRVTLVDRFGARLARREFTPAEYLPGRAPPTQLLAPGARVDADLLIADPGSDAVGFELDVCLPRRGRVVCGTDLRHGGG